MAAAGYIPARAGEARFDAVIAQRARVHPRACGGSGAEEAGRAAGEGTSPRVRGKLLRDIDACLRKGYIPARAGEAPPDVQGPNSVSVHPRACGGSLRRGLAAVRKLGTSPRVRGKLRRGRLVRVTHRYIPARAGEATRRRRARPNARVHPRACGGSRLARESQRVPVGTSPRVRGKRPSCARAGTRGGYIPARAGEAVDVGVGRQTMRVHPRACGGSRAAAKSNPNQTGTSPRVRGKRRRRGRP